MIRLDLERGLDKVRIISSEEITWNEIFGFEDIFSIDLTDELSHIPEEIFLKDSFSTDTKFLTKCIQSRFSGVWLPTTVEDCHIGICHCRDQITVKINIWNSVICDNLCISRRPILIVVNCLTHLGFNLSHGVSDVVITTMGQFGGE